MLRERPCWLPTQGYIKDEHDLRKAVPTTVTEQWRWYRQQGRPHTFHEIWSKLENRDRFLCVRTQANGQCRNSGCRCDWTMEPVVPTSLTWPNTPLTRHVWVAPPGLLRVVSSIYSGSTQTNIHWARLWNKLYLESSRRTALSLSVFHTSTSTSKHTNTPLPVSTFNSFRDYPQMSLFI